MIRSIIQINPWLIVNFTYFPKFGEEPKQWAKWKTSLIHTDSQQMFVILPSPSTFNLKLKLLSMSVTTSVKNSFDHSSHFNTDTPPWWTFPPSPQHPLDSFVSSVGLIQVFKDKRQKTSWRRVYNPNTLDSPSPVQSSRARWPHKNTVYANPSPLNFQLFRRTNELKWKYLHHK